MMNDPQDTSKRLPIVPFLEVLSRHRRLIIAMTFAAAFFAGVVGFMIPTTFQSSLTILPPEQSSSMGSMAGGVQSTLAILQLGLSTIASSDLYADIVKSRSVFRYTVDKLNLLEVYGLSDRDTLIAYKHAYDQLAADVNVQTANNGMISIIAQTHTGFFPTKEDKKEARFLVARIANTIAEGLDVVNRAKNTSRARQARIQLEQQATVTNEHLEKATEELAEFQAEHLAINLDEQMKASIETAGRLQGELLAREIALGVALQSMQPDNPEILRLKSEIRELRRRIEELKVGPTAHGDNPEPGSPELGLVQIPELGRTYARHLREVKIQETVFELLTEQLYRARFQEAQDIPVIQVLDEATVPAFKSKPVIRKLVMVAALLAFIASIFLAHALEWWRRYPGREADAAGLRRVFRLRG